MRCFVFALMQLGTVATAARAQDDIPDLKGTWSGKGKAIVFGNNLHHPGTKRWPIRRVCTKSMRPMSLRVKTDEMPRTRRIGMASQGSTLRTLRDIMAFPLQ